MGKKSLITNKCHGKPCKGIILDGLPIYEGTSYTYKTSEGNNFRGTNMVDLSIQLDTIKITVHWYITNHESNQNLILGNLFINSLNDYIIGKNEIEMSYRNEICFFPKIKTLSSYQLFYHLF